jgi:hypothetical protein
MAVPDFCLQNMSPNLTVFWRIRILSATVIVSAWQPAQSGKVLRKGCSTSSTWAVSMLIYIDTALQEKNKMFDGSKLMSLSRLSRCAELLM